MRHIKCALIAAVAAIGFASIASAADMPVKAAKGPIIVPFSWSGFYVGLNAGGAWGKSNVSYVPPGLPFATTAAAAAYSAIGSGTINSTGFTGGIQAGYNWQTGQAVLGLEADFNAFSLKGDFTQTGAPPGFVNLLSNASIKTDWLATVRGRLGWAVFDRGLIYATGGLAVTNFKYDHTNTYALIAGTSTSSFSSHTTRAGWTVGGGLEYAFNPKWSGKVEYLYMDFGSVSGTGTPAAPGSATPGHTYSADLKANVVRVGINYRY